MLTRVRAAITELVAADRALAEMGLQDIAAGVTEEYAEYLAANTRAEEALAAVPALIRFPADWWAAHVNDALWREVWAAEAEARKDAD